MNIGKIEYLIKHNSFLQKCFKFFFNNFFRFIGLFCQIDNSLILFTGLKAGFNDSSREIFEYIVKQNYSNEYKIVWAVKEPENVNIENSKVIKIDTFKYFLTALRAKYWVACVNIERSLNFKKRKTVYLNTWHGIPIKTVGNCANGRSDFNFSKINYFCVSSNYEKEVYIKSFGLKETSLIETGLPRNDSLFKNINNNHLKEQIKKSLNLPLNKKIILYAPTWRDSNDNGATYSFKSPLDFNELKKLLSSEYIILLRAHPYTNKLLNINFDSFVLDYSFYNNLNDLLIVADVLVTDYSSIIFDYSILEKPLICFAFDFDEYSKNRGFALDFKTNFSNLIVTNQKSLINELLTMNIEKNIEFVRCLKHQFVSFGGNATEKCVKKLLGK